MEKRGNVLWDNAIYLLLFLLFFGGMYWFVSGYKDAAVPAEEFYAKEIAFLINNAEPGTEFKIDVSRLGGIASDNGKDVRKIINIDNVNNRVVVSTREGKGTSYGFFNDVDVADFRVELFSGGPDVNQFVFKVIEKQREDAGA